MGWLRKKARPTPKSTVAPSLTPEELERIGHAAYDGANPVGAVPSLVDALVIEALQSADFPPFGSDEHARLTDRFFEELELAANTAPDWGDVGAFLVASNYVTDDNRDHPTYLRLAAAGLRSLKASGVPAEAIPPYMVTLWDELNLEAQ